MAEPYGMTMERADAFQAQREREARELAHADKVAFDAGRKRRQREAVERMELDNRMRECQEAGARLRNARDRVKAQQGVMMLEQEIADREEREQAFRDARSWLDTELDTATEARLGGAKWQLSQGVHSNEPKPYGALKHTLEPSGDVTPVPPVRDDEILRLREVEYQHGVLRRENERLGTLLKETREELDRCKEALNAPDTPAPDPLDSMTPEQISAAFADDEDENYDEDADYGEEYLDDEQKALLRRQHLVHALAWRDRFCPDIGLLGDELIEVYLQRDFVEDDIYWDALRPEEKLLEQNLEKQRESFYRRVPETILGDTVAPFPPLSG